MTAFDNLAKTSGPWVHWMNPREIGEIYRTAADRDVLIIELDGARMRTLDDLFHEYARAFSFPEPWGENWSAFAEFMRNLKWLPARRYLVIISNGPELLSQDTVEMPTFLRHLEIQGKYWGNAVGLGYEWGYGDVPFHTVLLVEEE